MTGGGGELEKNVRSWKRKEARVAGEKKKIRKINTTQRSILWPVFAFVRSVCYGDGMTNAEFCCASSQFLAILMAPWRARSTRARDGEVTGVCSRRSATRNELVRLV